MSERSDFENQWKETFDGAEMTPSDSVWANIRADISASQAQKQSNLVVYWRWMAVASIALLIGVGIGSIYYYQAMTEDYLALASQEQGLLHDIALLEAEKCEIEELNTAVGEQASSTSITGEGSEKVLSNTANLLAGNMERGDETRLDNGDNTVLAYTSKNKNTPSIQEANEVYSPIIIDREKTPNTSSSLASNNILKDANNTANYGKTESPISLIKGLDSEPLAIVSNTIVPQKVPDMMEILKMQSGEKQDFRGMWAGLSIGGGSFESNIGQASGAGESSDVVELTDRNGQFFVANAGDVNQTSVESPAFSYAISADFGKQIGRKTYLQGGVEYSRYATEATSNVAINDSQAFLRYENEVALDKGALITTESYQLANNYEYVAIPLKLGYQLLNKKIGISLSSGVSTNLFLKNTLKDKSGDRSDVTVTSGESSPYKPLSFNGLFGAEISYQWNEHYQLAIVPDYRFSLDGVTKADAFIQSNPTAFFLGFRFKYILK